MSEATTLNSKLPLKGEKIQMAKVAAILGLLLFIVIINFFLWPLSTTKKEAKKTNETYELSYKQNPITHADMEEKNPPIINEAAELEKKLQEAKAHDFIERLQASQSAGSESTSMNNAMINTVQSPNSPVADNQNFIPHNIDPNTAFLMAASNTKAPHVYATHFGPLPFVIGQGKFIFATLAVAINSDLPGQITATVSQDVYGEQGRRVLIPKGSLLIGEYKSGLVNNQNRLFVVWTRVREPNGIDVMLGSEGTDYLGRAGLSGDTDYHFFARFGSAFLIAMIGAGASTVGVSTEDQENSASAYRQNISQALAQQANNQLNQNISIPPTINIHQGEKIVVFVNRDLDFSRVMR